MPSRGLPDGIPTETYLRAAKSFVESKYKDRNERIRSIFERRYNLKRTYVPEAFKNITTDYRSPLVRDVIKRSQSILSSAFPIPRVIPLSISIKDRDNSSLREKWLSAAYRKMSRGRNVYSQITDALPADGMAVWKVFLRTHRWDVQPADDESPEKYLARLDAARKSHFPFVWEHVPSTTYYPLAYDMDGLAEVIEITRRDAFEVMNLYGLSRDSQGYLTKEGIGDIRITPSLDGASDTLDCLEYWNRTDYVYMVENIIVEEGKHELGEPPYYDAYFAMSSVHDPTYETEGIADSMIRVQDQLDSFVTVHSNWLMLNGFPVGRLRPISEDVIDAYDQNLVVRARLGETYKAPPGYVFEWTPAPVASHDFQSLRDHLKEVTDRVSLAPILYGEARDISGPTSSNLITVAKSVFAQGVASITQAFDRMAASMQRTVEQTINAPVPLWLEDKKSGRWMELDPEDINGYYDVQHQLQPTIPMERMQKSIWLADAQARGAVSMRYYQEEGIGIGDPGEMDRETKVEEYRKSPEYRQMLMEEVAVQLGARREARGQGTPTVPPVGPGGIGGVPQVAGVQQGALPGFPPGQGGSQIAPPPGPTGPV